MSYVQDYFGHCTIFAVQKVILVNPITPNIQGLQGIIEFQQIGIFVQG